MPFGKAGFALVVTLTLMVLLSILAIGLLSLSTVSIRNTASASASQIAQANARLALSIAIGELQVHLGPDARITARAETLSKDSRVGGGVSKYTPQAWWVGVSHSDGVSKLTPGNKDIAWLVSGLNDGTISGGLTDPVKVISSGSLDLSAFTGGKDIEAGKVPVKNQQGVTAGAYAWFVDDNGMKAQLKPSDPAIRNDNPANPSGGVLAASYKPDILENMASIATATSKQLQLVGSLGDLELVGLSRPLRKSKYFSYTALSQGVLADVKRGGLKKDLTIAFERPVVFSSVFPEGNTPAYLLIDEEKLNSAADLKSNGYINWGIFRDFYNLKKNILIKSGKPVIQLNTFDNVKLLAGSTPMTRGQLGPHAMNEDGHPYGKPGGYAGNNYVQNPIFPVLSYLQQNAWLDYSPGKPAANGNSETKPLLTSNVQLYTSHYNPFNIGIYVHSDIQQTGIRVMGIPMVMFTVENVFNRIDGLGRKLESHAPGPLTIPPGRSQLLGFKSNVNVGDEVDFRSYSPNVKDLTFESVRRIFSLRTNLPESVNITTEFVPLNPAVFTGCSHNAGELEASQVFFTPIAWDKLDAGAGSVSTLVESASPSFNDSRKGLATNVPGKKFSQNVPSTALDSSSGVSMAFSLRTTRETNSPIRPLVDSNVRAQWNNVRWDSPLGLNVVATHSMDNSGEAEDRFIPMDISQPPLGFTYMGADRSVPEGTERVILFDVPRRDLVSLAQLQHAAAGRFSYEPSYIVANSYANPRLPLGEWKTSTNDTFSTATRGAEANAISGSFNLYDASYLVNEALWDSYTFTTIPQIADNFDGSDLPQDFDGLLKRTIQLPNPRFIPYQPAGSAFDQQTLQDNGTATTGSFHHNAGFLLVDGAFNVNSTSVDAWEAFLSGTHELPFQKISADGVLDGFEKADGVRFPRVTSIFGEGMDTKSFDPNFWTGFRALTQEEVREIAEETVKQVRDRGPFLTLGAFVNRKLTSGEEGKSSTLQAALDNTVNKNVDGGFGKSAVSPTAPANSSQAAAFPGQMLQGDVLQALAPYISVRSDTFTIRAYGEARDPSSGNITATAWCEAVVQRYPDPVPTTNPKPTTGEELARPSSPFGRRFKVLSFRWLNQNEI